MAMLDAAAKGKYGIPAVVVVSTQVRHIISDSASFSLLSLHLPTCTVHTPMMSILHHATAPTC